MDVTSQRVPSTFCLLCVIVALCKKYCSNLNSHIMKVAITGDLGRLFVINGHELEIPLER